MTRADVLQKLRAERDYLRERHGCDPVEFAERRSWGPYLALGYRLTRLQEKLTRAAESAIPVASAAGSAADFSVRTPQGG